MLIVQHLVLLSFSLFYMGGSRRPNQQWQVECVDRCRPQGKTPRFAAIGRSAHFENDATIYFEKIQTKTSPCTNF